MNSYRVHPIKGALGFNARFVFVTTGNDRLDRVVEAVRQGSTVRDCGVMSAPVRIDPDVQPTTSVPEDNRPPGAPALSA